MPKHRYILLIIIILSIFLLLNQCAISDIVNAVNNSDDISVKWDVDFKIPMIEKTIKLEDYIDPPDIDPISIDVPGGSGIPVWPVPVDTPELNFNGDITPLGLDIDFDGIGGDDFTVKGLWSPDADLKMNVWLVDSTSANFIINDPDAIQIDSLTIEGVTYTVGAPHYEGYKLVYDIADFPKASEDYCIFFSVADTLTVEDLDITLKNAGTDPGGVGGYDVRFEFVFTLGNEYGVIGELTQNAIIIGENDIPLPIDSLPMDEINKFEFEMIFNSGLAFGLDINLAFTADITPSPNAYNLDILSGNLDSTTVASVPITYSYVEKKRETKDTFTFDDNVLSYGNIKMNYNISVTANPGVNILFTNTDEMDIRLNVGGEATLGM